MVWESLLRLLIARTLSMQRILCCYRSREWWRHYYGRAHLVIRLVAAWSHFLPAILLPSILCIPDIRTTSGVISLRAIYSDYVIVVQCIWAVQHNSVLPPHPPLWMHAWWSLFMALKLHKRRVLKVDFFLLSPSFTIRSLIIMLCHGRLVQLCCSKAVYVHVTYLYAYIATAKYSYR